MLRTSRQRRSNLIAHLTYTRNMEGPAPLHLPMGQLALAAEAAAVAPQLEIEFLTTIDKAQQLMA